MKQAGWILVWLLTSSYAFAQTNTPDLGLLDSLWVAGESQALVEEVDKLLAIPAPAKIKKAEALIALADFRTAKEVLDDVQKSAGNYDAAAFETALARYELATGRSDLALTRLQKTWDALQREGKSETIQAARTLALLSTALSSLGSANEAIRFGEQALTLRQRLPQISREELAASYNDLGLVSGKIDPDRALANYDQALPLYENLHGPMHPKIAIINTNMGYVYNDLKLYGDAITNFETALSIWQKIYPQGHPNEAFVRLNLGRTYAKLNNLPATKAYYRQALALYQKAFGAQHPDIATTLNQIGMVYQSESMYDSALYFFQQALISNTPDFKSTEVARYPRVANHYNGLVLLFSLQQKSKTLEERYFGKTLALKDLTTALNGLLVCDSLIDRIRQQNENEADKLALSSLATEIYQDGVRITKALSEVTTKSNSYRQLCFYFAEKSKSAVLQESIADAQAKSFAGIPSELLEQEKELKAAMTLVSQKIQNKPSADEEKKLRDELFQLNERSQDFVKKLERDFPAYYDLKFKRSLPSVAELQSKLDAQEAIVSYFLEDQGNGLQRIYLFTITKKRLHIETRSIAQPLARVLVGFANSLYFSDAKVYHQTGQLLNQWLRPRLPRAVQRVVIIPDSQLSTLPFEALPGRRNFESFQTAQYWNDEFAISYQFSSGLLTKNDRPTAEPTIYLCAPVEFEAAGLPNLPATEAEVRTIASLFQAQQQLDLFSAASEARVKSGELRGYQYLHFATHGVVDAREPGRSRLFLQPGKDEDGFLYSGEIYNLELKAQLAVLSACQTGLGKISKGEGVIGLSRALVYAGAQNLVVSFWSVADESTMQLMRSFYEHMKTNPRASFAECLQVAKRKLRNQKLYQAPYYWAPFVLIGS
jgi:CHAT domain-containing protein